MFDVGGVGGSAITCNLPQARKPSKECSPMTTELQAKGNPSRASCLNEAGISHESRVQSPPALRNTLFPVFRLHCIHQDVSKAFVCV